MHILQKKLLALADEYDLGKLKLRQIAELLGDSQLHPQRVKHHITQLQKMGLLEVDRDKGVVERVRSDSKRRSNFVAIPVLGAANCGEPLEFAVEHAEGYLRVSRSMLSRKRDVYALRAVGSSMDQAHVGSRKQSIQDGDYAIVDSSDRDPTPNSYVVSVIDGMANIKKLTLDKTEGTVILVSESSEKLPPIYIHPDDFNDYMISGKVIQIIRQPQAS